MKTPMLLVLAALLSSCATPIGATANRVGNIEGRACMKNILFLIPLSLDASVYSAAKQAGINQIATVDQEHLYTGIYNSVCTVVHGTK
jgi:hypothetical protein